MLLKIERVISYPQTTCLYYTLLKPLSTPEPGLYILKNKPLIKRRGCGKMTFKIVIKYSIIKLKYHKDKEWSVTTANKQEEPRVPGIVYITPFGTHRAVTQLGQESDLIKRLKTANPAIVVIKQYYFTTKKAVINFLTST